jgi:hypothetical protein
MFGGSPGSLPFIAVLSRSCWTAFTRFASDVALHRGVWAQNSDGVQLRPALAKGRACAALHMSKLVFARSFSLSFLLTKITSTFTSRRLRGRLWCFLSASATEETAH